MHILHSFIFLPKPQNPVWFIMCFEVEDKLNLLI